MKNFGTVKYEEFSTVKYEEFWYSKVWRILVQESMKNFGTVKYEEFW
jgi:hypothetical protein